MHKTQKHEPPVLAIDLGGTNIVAAIISNKGQIVAKECHLTLADRGPQSVINEVFSTIDHLLNLKNIDLSQLHSIGIASTGALDGDMGLITSFACFPGWDAIPLRDIVKEKYKVDTFLLNDASAAALGEHHFGIGKGAKNLIYITVSTGIGSGIIINDKLYSGASGSAGEIGYMTIDVNRTLDDCGNNGCLEMLASATAVSEEAQRRIRQGERSSLTKIVEEKIEDITAEKVGLAAQGGDPLALEVISRTATYLGVGLLSLVNIFNPEMIIVGGGLSKLGDLLLDPARQVMRERVFSLPAQAVRIVPAQLGDDAGMLGAAVYARQQEQS